MTALRYSAGLRVNRVSMQTEAFVWASCRGCLGETGLRMFQLNLRSTRLIRASSAC